MMIYFITDGEFMKIGFTDNQDVSQRMASLQCGNARELILLACIDGGRELESLLHRVFDGYRVRGEWFLYDPLNKSVTEEDIVDSRSAALRSPMRQRVLSEKKKKLYELLESSFDMPDSEIAKAIGATRQYVWQVRKSLKGKPVTDESAEED